MAISFTCSCGKALKAKDDAAGKKLKCPQCARSVVVPATEGPRSPMPAASKTVTPVKKPLPPVARPATPKRGVSGADDASPSVGKAFAKARPLASPQPPASSTKQAGDLEFFDDDPFGDLTPPGDAPTFTPPSGLPVAPPSFGDDTARADAGAVTISGSPARVADNPWADRSLEQQPTPWLPGDEERCQRGINAPRESDSMLMPVAIMGMVGAIVAALTLL